MSTRDERREVVGALRQITEKHSAVEASRVASALGLEYKVYGTVVAFDIDAVRRLAKLIDRPTCRNVSEHKDVFACSECRCEVEVTAEICNEYGEPFSEPLMPSFCPNCGARVVTDNDAR